MRRHRKAFAGLALTLAWTAPADADGVAVSTPSPITASTQVDPAVTLIRALSVDPMTAPYQFTVRPAGRQLALSGRVGSRVVHDAAMRVVIGLGYPVRDDLTIDTFEAYRSAPIRPVVSRVPYVYPPSLFGRLDDPFYGMEPPLVTYPPFAGSIATREPINLAKIDAAMSPGPAPVDAITVTIDSRGIATLRGRVPTQAERTTAEQEVGRVRGVTQVINLLDVGAATAQVGSVPTVSDTPPPPPTPARIPVPRPPAPSIPNATRAPINEPRPAVVTVDDPLARRVVEAFARRPALAGATIQVAIHEGEVTLNGHAPTAFEAMLAYRAAQQTPGVREVVDKVEYPLPDVDQVNPLAAKGRPADVEPYLLSHVRRQCGDLAHVDQLHLRGNTVEIAGTVTSADDLPRVEAALRSIPLLRGFRLDPQFQVD